MLTITVQDAALRQYLASLDARLHDLTPALADVGYLLETNTRKRFGTATDPNGRKWEEWAESTRESYPKDGNGKLLERYSTMLGSLSYQVEQGGRSVRVGFAQPYAVYHEWGTRKMPRRGLLMADPDAGTLGAQDLSDVLAIINTWIAGAP